MHPLVAFLIDIAEGAVFGAALAALALPDGVTDAAAATVIIAGGAIGGAKAVARQALRRYVAARKAKQEAA